MWIPLYLISVPTSPTTTTGKFQHSMFRVLKKEERQINEQGTTGYSHSHEGTRTSEQF